MLLAAPIPDFSFHATRTSPKRCRAQRGLSIYIHSFHGNALSICSAQTPCWKVQRQQGAGRRLRAYTSMGHTDPNTINNPMSHYRLRQTLEKEPKGADIRIKGKCALVKMASEGLSEGTWELKKPARKKNILGRGNSMCKGPGAQISI